MSSAGATTSGMEAATVTGTRWRSVLVLEGVETDDGRLIDPGALDWRDLPLSLMAMDATGPGGHEGARLAGRIDTITRNTMTGEVVGEGVFDSSEFGVEIARLVSEEMLTGVSVDLAIREFEIRGQDGGEVDPLEELFGDEQAIFAVTDASIMGATVCPFPAFADASIELLASGEDGPIREARFLMQFVPVVVDPEELALEDGEQSLADGGLVETLRVLFSDTATMGASARGFALNAAQTATFAAIYRDLVEGTDAIGEQVLALGGQNPVGLVEIVALRTFEDAADNPNEALQASSLFAQNLSLLGSLNAAFIEATAAEQFGIADVLSKRIERHQRWSVQLRGLMAA